MYFFFLLTGRLHVYIKPESKRLKDLEPAFSKSGDQGDRWYQGYVPLPANLFENFQVCSFQPEFYGPQKINHLIL